MQWSLETFKLKATRTSVPEASVQRIDINSCEDPRLVQHTQMQPTIDPNFDRTRSLELFGSSVELRNCAPWTGQLHVWTGYLNGVSERPSLSVWITRQANQIGWLSHFKVGEHWQPKVRFVRDDGNHSDWCSLELLAVCRAFLSRSF